MENNIYVNGDYIKNNPNYHLEDSPWKAKQITKIIRKNNITFNNLCEVGCGAGEIISILQNKEFPNVQYTGFDISPDAINIAKQKENDKMHFYCKDIFLEKNAYFDLMLCIDVFEHIEDYYTFLRKLRTHSRYTIFHIPLEMTALSILRLKPILDTWTNVGHLHFFCKDTAIRVLKQCGYTIVANDYTTKLTEEKNQGIKIPRPLLYKINKDLCVRLFGAYSMIVLTDNNQ
jgi:SAM-dependent methyltransferase